MSTDAQKQADAEFRRTHPIPQNETADEKKTREAAEKAEKAQANGETSPDRY